MRKIIYITGITSSGKTTAAEKLSIFLNIPFLKADDVYSMIARELKYDRADKLVMPEFWKKFEGFSQLKIKYYKELLKDIKGDFIIEGFPLFFEQDRQIIENIIGEHFKTIFKLEIPVDTWINYANGKLGGYHSEQDYAYLNRFFEVPKQFYKITDPKQLLVTGELYQREGFTDKKWELLNINKKDLSGKSIIDLGCNSGWIADNCFTAGASEVSGVDYNWRYLDQAREKGIKSFLCDLDEFNFDKEYDVVLCLAVFHYIRDKELFLKKVASATKELFVLEIPVYDKDPDGIALHLHDTGKCQYFIPTIKLITLWLNKYFSRVEISNSIPPDNSFRLIFKCYK